MSPDIATKTEIIRLEWLGHLIRMENTSIPKMIVNTTPETTRGVGRPKSRWLDDVEADNKKMETQSSRQKRMHSNS
jgi:hypothetical protein